LCVLAVATPHSRVLQFFPSDVWTAACKGTATQMWTLGHLGCEEVRKAAHDLQMNADASILAGGLTADNIQKAVFGFNQGKAPAPAPAALKFQNRNLLDMATKVWAGPAGK